MNEAAKVLPAEPLVVVTRGQITESRHRGHVIVVAPDSSTVAELGSPDTITYLRSSAKPHQALPLIVTGAADRFGFTDKEIALACASHSGEPVHTSIVASMLEKIGLPSSALKCGIHEPFNAEAARRLRKTGEAPNVLQNNCSGKHAGMLALALHLGAPIETYDHIDHPVQQAVSHMVAQFSGVPADQIYVGTDGCGVPVFGVSVRAMAVMYARLVTPPEDFQPEIRTACQRVVSTMMAFPELIGGTSDRLDTEIMRAASGRLVSKVGAEGVYTAGVLPCKEWPRGLGFALKIEDGDDHRARPTVVIESLRQLRVLQDESLQALAQYASFRVLNRRGETVGTVRPNFHLSYQRLQ